jgi:hypothetical protein
MRKVRPYFGRTEATLHPVLAVQVTGATVPGPVAIPTETVGVSRVREGEDGFDSGGASEDEQVRTARERCGVGVVE